METIQIGYFKMVKTISRNTSRMAKQYFRENDEENNVSLTLSNVKDIKKITIYLFENIIKTH